MTEVKPMAVLKDGIQTMPCAIGRMIELYESGPLTPVGEAEMKSLLEASKRLADNLKDIMDVIM